MDARIGEERKARVLTCAEVVFLRQGYSRTTMGDLAAASGMSRPAFYLVYPRKHEVFSSIIRDEAQFKSNHDARSEAALLQHWMVWVCTLWLGEREQPSSDKSVRDVRGYQRSEVLPKEIAFLESILDDGLAKRLPPELPESLRTATAQALTFCVCGLIGCDLDDAARRDLLVFQVAALAQALLGSTNRRARPASQMTTRAKMPPATGRVVTQR